MGDSDDTAQEPPVQDLTPEEASRIISSHRKVRYGKYQVLSRDRGSRRVRQRRARLVASTVGDIASSDIRLQVHLTPD